MYLNQPAPCEKLRSTGPCLWLATRATLAGLWCLLLAALPLRAQPLYWDSNGATTGAGAIPTGTWGTDLFWSTDPLGELATAAWISGRNAVFSAGADASGAFTVTVTGTQTAGGMTIEEGTVTIAGGAVALGTGNITINSGATLSTDSSLRITASVGSTMFINGGTARSTNPNSAGSFADVDQVIVLGPGGGTLSYTVAGVLNIVQTTTTISGTGPLTKAGAGILAIASPCSYSGSTIVNDGTLRVRATSNRLPITTDVLLNSPGTLDPGSTSEMLQQVNTINGNGNITYSASSTLLIAGDADSTITGIISDGAFFGRVSKQGMGTLTLSGLNTYDGRFTNDAGTTTISPGAAWCGPACDIYMNGGVVNLNNAAQTILSIAGAGGTVNLSSGHTLTVNNGSTKVFTGTLAGPGALTKTGTAILALGGNSTYDGNTLVSAGRIRVDSANGLGSTSGYTEVASGAEILFDGAGSVFTINEPFRLAGPGGAENGAIAVQNNANIVIAGPVTLTGDTTNTVSGTGTVLYNNSAAVTALANQNLTLQGGASSTGNGGTISGVISLGTGTLTKQQGGRWTLSGANDYSGGTFVNAGNLRVANTTGSATGSGAVTVNAGATLSGPGSIAGEFTLNGTLAPGASPGTMNTASEIWNGGASYVWEINDAAGMQGADPGWDHLNITGTLTINAMPGSKFNINMNSLTLANTAGFAINFDNTQDYTWIIATASGGITGFDAAAINLNTSSFNNALGNGLFFVEQSGNNIQIRFVRRPAVTVAPLDPSAVCGEMVTFTATPTGTAPFGYQWRKGGVDLMGETASTLALGAVSASSAGSYTVVVTNLYGSITSAPTVLTIIDTNAPMITCPGSVTNKTTSSGGGVVTFVPSATDDCGTPTVACVPPSGSTFPTGTSPVSCTATDAAGNSNSCSFNVTVLLQDSTNFLVGVSIPDADPNGLANTQTVSTAITYLTDVNVTLNVSGTFNGDLYAQLTHSSGFSVLLNRVGRRAADARGYDDDGLNITLDDQSTNGNVHIYRLTLNGDHATPLGGALTNNWAPDARTNSPTTVLDTDAPDPNAFLSAFNGLDPNGSWTLTVADYESGDTGSLVSWGLELCGLVGPSITVSPASVLAYAGSNVSFSVTAAGSVPFSYQWTHAGTNLPGATGATLNLANVNTLNEGAYAVVVANAAGSITSSVAVLTLQRDFGDAPDPTYPTLLANNGARHVIVAGFYLGTAIDAEGDGQPTLLADGDDNNGVPDDEDGVTSASGFSPGQMASVTVFASAPGILSAWIDYSANGSWADAGEHVAVDVPLVAGSNPLSFAVPLTAVIGPTRARLRFASVGGLSTTGDAPDGEVEDYVLLISANADVGIAKADAPDPVAVGSNLTYTIVVTNIGPNTATMVSLADVLPPSAVYVSATPSQGSCAHLAGIVTCDLASLSAGASATVTIVVTGSVAALITNAVSVTAAEPDPNLANNSATAVTTVLDPPVVTVPPASLSVCPGSNAVFTVTATGEPPLTYTWRKDGTNLVGESGATLTILNVSNANAGSYDVVVANSVGSTISSAATLTVLAPTTATALTAVANACPGAAANFSTTASGTGPFSYRWTKDGVELMGETGSSLSFTVAANSGGNYCVEVTGLCSSVTNCATLSVAVAPAITAQPQNQTTPMGNGAVFSVTASSPVALSYQWESNGVTVAGATGASLAVSNVALANNGDGYRVIVSNCAGSTTSTVATLTVTPIAGISFDFDTPLQFTNAPSYLAWNSWINNGFILPPAVFESPIGGVGPYPGSGALDMPPNNATENTSVLLPVNYDFSLVGKTLNVSTMFKVKTPQNATRRATQMGFITSTNIGINDQNPQGFMTVILQSGATTPVNGWNLRTQRRNTGGGLQESTNFVAPLTLTPSNWYKFNASFINTKTAGNNTYTIACSLQDMGPLGTTPGATNATFTTTTNNADIVNSRNVFFALRSFEDGGMEFRDNTYVWTTGGDLFFVQAPQNLTLAQGRRGMFQGLVDGEGPYTYQWQRSDGGPFTDIPGARSWNYLAPAARTSDNGSQYRVVVTGPANTITSAAATLTVAPETLSIVSVGSVDGTTVGVQYSQPVDPATAENPANYTIDGTAPKHARVFRTSAGAQGPEGIYVVLVPQTVLSGPYTVVAAGVQDLSGGAIGAGNSATGLVENLTGFDVNPLVTAPAGGNHSFGPGQFIVSGGGADIFGTADQFRYVYTTRTGDFDVMTRIPYMDTVRFVSKAAILARPSLEPFGPMVMAGFNPGPIAEGSGTLRQFTEGNVRQTWNVGAAGWGANARLFPPDVWVRLRRSGNTFLRYSSTNGVNWVFDGQMSMNVPFPSTVYVGLAVCAVRNTQLETAQFESVREFGGYAGAVVAISSQPTNMTVAAGGSTNNGIVATITGGGAPGSGVLSFVWQRNDGSGNWTNLVTAGATNHTVTIGPLFVSDHGAQFRCVVRTPGVADVLSAVFTATVTDTLAPTLAAANAAVLPSYPVSEVLLMFSENVSAASATNVANYLVTNAAGQQLTVLSATFLGSDPRVIVLRVSGPLGTGTASVAISGVQDLNNNVIATTVRTFRSFPPSTGPVVVEVYQDVGAATDIPSLTGHALYTGGTPTFICYSNLFGFNVGFGGIQDNYGIKAYTHFVPPASGAYKFWLRSDDAGQLRMNTNAVDSTSPAGAVLIAENTGANATYTVGTTPANSQTNITLVAGQRYYMEFLLKEGGGGDGFSVTFTAPTVNTAPAATTFIATSALEYPTGVVSTPVVMEIYTGYQNFLPGFNQMAGLTAATNYPVSDYALDVVNYKYIAGVPDVIGYQKYFGAQPVTLGNTRLDNYLGRLQAYFVAPSNGLYRFWMGVDDVGQLYMNTNALNSTDPAGMVRLGISANAFVSTASQLIAQNVPLTGGQRYYMMALWREGGGGDGIRLAVRSQGDAGTPPTSEIIPASMLEYPLAQGRAGAVNFTGILPANPVVTVGQSLRLSAAGIMGTPLNAAGSVNGAPYGYIWLKNGVPILENTFTNTTPPMTMADNGAVYTLIVSNWFSRAERSVMVTVMPEGVLPTIVRTVGWRGGDGFTLQFSEPMDTASATYLANYMGSGGLRLLSAWLDASRTMLSVQTGPQLPGTTYTVMVTGVRDASGNAVAPGTTTTFSTWAAGGCGILVELFTNIPNSAILDLTGQAKFVANMPDVVYYTNVFGVGAFGANSLLENYGARITSYFVPSNTGHYRFYLRSDDASQLYMNINSADSQNPAGRVMLVHQPNANITVQDPRSISPPVLLNAGQAYYTEALMKEGTGGDYLMLTFRQTDANGTAVSVPADAVTEIASATTFGGAPGNPDAVTILSTPPSDVFTNENDFVSLSLNAVVAPHVLRAVCYQWQKFDSISMAYTNIPGATLPTLNFFAPLADNNVAYRLLFLAPGANRSYVTTLHVTADSTPPFIVSANSLNGTNIDLCFNEPLEFNSIDDDFNYTVNGGLRQVLTAIVRPDNRSVTLTLDSSLGGPGTAFTVQADNIVDLAVMPLSGSSVTNGSVQGLAPSSIGTPGLLAAGGYNPAVGESSFACDPASIDVSANGWDIWNAADGFYFVSRLVTGNFDVKARVQRLVGADQWSKAGLMARGSVASNSRFVMMMATPETTPISGQAANNFFTFQHRDADGASAAPALNNVNSPPPVGYPNGWVRLQRLGSVFNGYYSSNGVDWVLLLSRDSAANAGGAYPDTIEVGLATVSHNQPSLANNAFAEYRNLYFPPTPAITQQPGPSLVVTGIHQSVNFGGAVVTGQGPITYQWRKDGVAIPGATSPSLTFPDTQVLDTGIYTLLVANDGGGVISSNCQLIVTNALPVAGTDMLTATQNLSLSLSAGSLLGNDFDPEGAPTNLVAVSGVSPVTYSANFDDGLVPAGSSVTGVVGGGVVAASGGVNNSGYLKLTDGGALNAAGAMVINELTPNRRVSAFSASFMLRIGDGSAQPADGFNFSFGSDLPNTASTSFGENGAGTGFSFVVDNYQFVPLNVGAAANAPGGGTAFTSGMKVQYNNIIITGVQMPTWNTSRFVPVTINVTPAGVATVTVDGTNVFGNVTLPGYTARRGRFGLYGRTGGQSQSHWVDDLSINLHTLDTSHDILNGAVLHGNAYLDATTGVGGSGALHITDNVNNQFGAFVLPELTPGKAVASFTASFGLRIGNGTGNAADGFSFNLAGDLPNPVVYGALEEGVGTGLSLCIDNYPTGGADSPSLKLKLGGVQLGLVLIPKWSSTAYIPVNITLTSAGRLTVNVDGTNVVANLAIPYAPIAGRFGLFARTGGENETHWVDNLVVSAIAVDNTVGSYNANFNTTTYGTVTLAGGIVTYTPPPGVCGPDTFYYVLSDGQSGGTSIGRVDVLITEQTPEAPVIVTCLPNQPLPLPAGQCQLVLPDLTSQLVVTDNCCCVTIAQSPAPGTLLNIGPHTLTFTVTDTLGLTASCMATVSVSDVTPPVIVCPANITAQCTGPGTVVTYSVSATDCDPTPSIGCLPASGSTFAMGSTLVTCIASDMSGNTTNCMFTVNVVASSASYVENVTVPDNNANGLARTRTFASEVGIITDLNVKLRLANGYNGDLYAYLVHDTGFSVLLNRVGRRAGDPQGYGDAGMDVTLDDQAANGDIHEYRLELSGTHSTPLGGPLTNSWAPDARSTDPALVLDTDARTELLSSFNGLNPNGEWTLYIADVSPLDTSTLISWGLEVCGLPPIPASVTQSPTNQTVACGTTVSFTMAANGTAPLTNQWYRNNTAIAGATGTTLTLPNVSVGASDTYYAVVRNMGGSSTSAPAVLTVIDLPPSILCPGQLFVECTGPSGAVATFSVTASDDCTPGIVAVCVPPSGTLFPHGNTTVNCTATDSSTNVATCSFLVHVVDTTRPVLCVTPPSTVVAGGLDGFTGPQPATPSVNLQTRLTGLDLRGFDDALTDAWFGHTASNLSMTAVDLTLRIRMRTVAGLPQNDTIILGFAGPGGALRPEQWTRYLGFVSGVDNGLFGGAPWSNATNEFVLNLAALPNRTGPSTDLVGAIRRYGHLDIMVQDDTAIDYVSLEVRSCQCQADIEQPATAGFCGATATFQTPVFTDVCDNNVSVVCSPPSGTFFPIGSTLIVCTATDDSGNSNNCAFSVNITEPPPRMTIQRQGASVVICWPATCVPYLLEQTSSLDNPITWTPVQLPPAVVGNQYCVTVPIQPGNRFFRLRRY